MAAHTSQPMPTYNNALSNFVWLYTSSVQKKAPLEKTPHLAVKRREGGFELGEPEILGEKILLPF